MCHETMTVYMLHYLQVEQLVKKQLIRKLKHDYVRDSTTGRAMDRLQIKVRLLQQLSSVMPAAQSRRPIAAYTVCCNMMSCVHRVI